MNRILFFLLLLIGCSPNQETNIVSNNSSNLDSLNSINNLQMENINAINKNIIDSLKKVISQEKLRTATDINVLDFENYIRIHCEITNDSIRVLGLERYEALAFSHTITFIDYNLNSIFHDKLIEGYRYEYNLAKNTSKIKNGHWVTIKKYDNYNYAFYYEMCNFMRRGFTISDSLLVGYNNMDETEGSISKIKTIESFDQMININDGEYILYPTVDNPEIFICNNRGTKSFIVHGSNLHKYPIIVQDCHDSGANPQINFLEPK